MIECFAPLKRTVAIVLVLALCLAGCTSSKKIIYFQNIDDAVLNPVGTDYEAVIKKDDRLTIVVSAGQERVRSVQSYAQ